MTVWKHGHGAGRDQLPDSLGPKTGADSLSIVFASDAALPITLDNDTNFGAPGADTLRTAAMIGVGSTAVSNANPVPISDAGGSITVDGTVAATVAALAYSYSDFHDYAAVNVTAGAWVEVIASTAAAIKSLFLSDQSGEIMELGVGAEAAEARVFLIPRGFSGQIPLAVAASARISIRAVTATATTGELVLTGLA